MWAPGAVGVAVAGVILLFMKDSPEAAGFPPIEQAQGKKGGLQVHRSQSPAGSGRLWPGGAGRSDVRTCRLVAAASLQPKMAGFGQEGQSIVASVSTCRLVKFASHG